MASKAYCYEQITKYENLKTSLARTVGLLRNANGCSTNLGNKIESVYTVNDSGTPIVERCEKLATSIGNEANFITGTVIPACDESINSLKQEIARIEEEERKAREEAERIAREVAENNAREAEAAMRAREARERAAGLYR